MELLPVDAKEPDPVVIDRAAARIRDGHLVAFPTETVYGLGANALDERSIARIYEAKGRPKHNPVIVHVADVAAARGVVAKWPRVAEQLAARWWPGPLTIVLDKHASIPDSVTAGLTKVGVRVPAHPVALALLRAAGVPIAAPSANRANGVSPTTAQHVQSSLPDADVLVLDGGSCIVGIESTVLDLSGAVPTLLRPGGVSRTEIEQELGMPILLAEANDDGDARRAAPGMLKKHYAPRAKLVRIPHGDVNAMTRAIAEAGRDGELVAALAIGERVCAAAA
ncbi:MAG: L-threonylcarbamoyladenylate synthase, partial [Planctomycetota bacterium]